MNPPGPGAGYKYRPQDLAYGAFGLSFGAFAFWVLSCVAVGHLFDSDVHGTENALVMTINPPGSGAGYKYRPQDLAYGAVSFAIWALALQVLLCHDHGSYALIVRIFFPPARPSGVVWVVGSNWP